MVRAQEEEHPKDSQAAVFFCFYLIVNFDLVAQTELFTIMRVNTPNVVHETIDGEVILLNLRTGNYYSFEGLGAFIWNFIDSEAGWSTLPSLMSKAYNLSLDDVHNDVELFVAKLVSEELVVEGPLVLDFNSDNITDIEAQMLEICNEYIPPVVNKYSDMQDLLLLDPIHDVDQKGWPQKKDS